MPPDDGPVAPDDAALDHDPGETTQLCEASSRRLDAVVTSTPPRSAQSRLTPRRAVLAALVAGILLAAIASVPTFHRDKSTGAPSVERAQALFATAQKLDQEGRERDAQATLVEALQVYDELIRLNPDQNASPLAPAIIQALGRAGVSFSVAEAPLHAWLADPVFTPYPAISQVFLLQGWRLKSPVFLDVIVSNYVHTPGITSPHNAADVRLDALKAAILAAWNVRHETQATEFDQLLKPRNPT
jgi:hypothetical protein